METESLAQDQFVLDSCCLVSRSNYWNNSKKDYDWPILAYVIRDQIHADAKSGVSVDHSTRHPF